MDEIIEISKKEPLLRNEILVSLNEINLNVPEQAEVKDQLLEPLLTMATAIHSEYELISKTILFTQRQIDLDLEAFERVMKNAVASLKSHAIHLKRLEDISRCAEDLHRSTKTCCEKMQNTMTKLSAIQPNLPAELSISHPKMLKRFPVLAQFLKSG